MPIADHNSYTELEAAAAFYNFGDTGNLNDALVECILLLIIIFITIFRHSVLH
jgi:hypothetical protein